MNTNTQSICVLYEIYGYFLYDCNNSPSQECTKQLVCRCYRSSRQQVFFVKGALKICRKFTGEHTCRSVFSIKLLCSFIEIILWHGCSPVNLLHIFRTPFLKNTYGWLFLMLEFEKATSHHCSRLSTMNLEQVILNWKGRHFVLALFASFASIRT